MKELGRPGTMNKPTGKIRTRPSLPSVIKRHIDMFTHVYIVYRISQATAVIFHANLDKRKRRIITRTL